MPYQPGGLRDRQQRVAQISQDYGQFDGILPGLQGQDQFYGSAGMGPDYEWPMPSYSRLVAQRRIAQTSQDFGQQDGTLPLLQLVGGGPVGSASVTLPPGYQGNVVRTARFVAVRANTLGEFNGLLPQLSGADAMLAGLQLTDSLPPRAAPRARDYTHAQAIPLNLLGQDALVVGKQLSGNAPGGARRGNPSFELSSPLELLTTIVEPIPYGAQLTDALNPRAAARARDYTQVASFPLELIGKDQFYGSAGEVLAYDWSYQRPKPRYLQGTGEPVQNLLGTLLSTAYPPGQQLSGNTPAAARRARDYSIAFSFLLTLIGQDNRPEGQQLSGNVPAGPRRAVDYSIAAAYLKTLIGRDAMAPGDQVFEVPPGPRRLVDYTWTHGYAGSFPQETLPDGRQWFDLAPRGALRARDYTFLSWAPLSTTVEQRDLEYALGEPRSAWRIREPRGSWLIDTPRSSWRTKEPRE